MYIVNGRIEVERPGARTRVFMQSRNNPVHFYVMLCGIFGALQTLLTTHLETATMTIIDRSLVEARETRKLREDAVVVSQVELSKCTDFPSASLPTC